VVQAKTYNLRQLHEEDGHHKRVGALMNDWEYALRFGLLGVLQKKGAITDKPDEKIKDPLEECVENLLGLSAFDPDNLGVAAWQVESFTRYAITDPWQISREICVRGLGRAGVRLHVRDFPAPPKEGAPATEDEVREALRVVIQSATPPERRTGPAPDLETACRDVAALNLDVDGARRALLAVALIAQTLGEKTARVAPLQKLSLELQRRCVRFALERALTDDNGMVRAAAIEADVRVFGKERLAAHFERLTSDRDSEVALRVLDLVERYGLPPYAVGASPEDDQRARDQAIARLYASATHDPDDTVRVRGMEVLARVTDAGIRSLREEDWQTWWLARNATQAGAASPDSLAPPSTPPSAPPPPAGAQPEPVDPAAGSNPAALGAGAKGRAP
jgi:hypothetical protein